MPAGRVIWPRRDTVRRHLGCVDAAGGQEQLGETAWDRLLAWAQVDAASVQTQAELWQVRQPTVSQTLQPLIEAGAVEALPRPGREAIRYLMTGTARLAL